MKNGSWRIEWEGKEWMKWGRKEGECISPKTLLRNWHVWEPLTWKHEQKSKSNRKHTQNHSHPFLLPAILGCASPPTGLICSVYLHFSIPLTYFSPPHLDFEKKLRGKCFPCIILSCFCWYSIYNTNRVLTERTFLPLLWNWKIWIKVHAVMCQRLPSSSHLERKPPAHWQASHYPLSPL